MAAFGPTELYLLVPYGQFLLAASETRTGRRHRVRDRVVGRVRTASTGFAGDHGQVMASLLSPRRPTAAAAAREGDDVRLTATRPVEPEAEDSSEPAAPRYGWQLVAVGGALATALAGWVIVAGLCVVGWLPTGQGELTGALQLGTALWLLGHGTPADLGSLRWTVAPLTLSLLIAFMISRFARGAVRFADPDGRSEALRVTLACTGLMTVGYAAAVAAVGLTTGAEMGRGIVGAVLIAAVGSLWGSSRGLGVRITDRLPWLRPVPDAVVGGVGVLLLVGAAVLVTGIVMHADRIASLNSALGAGVIGGIALWAAQAAFAPNLVVWASSYSLGGGFTLGDQTVVAPTDVSLGILPSIPILGALPAEGAGPDWAPLWLAGGVLAGATAAWLAIRRWPAARFDEISLVGGMAGAFTGLVFTGLAWLTGGDLGQLRLAGVGPRMMELLVMSVTLLGLAGCICGLVLGLIRNRPRPAADEAVADEADTEEAESDEPEDDEAADSAEDVDEIDDEDTVAVSDLPARPE